MAIPFNVPSDEYTLDQYRRIHQLLLDLMDILRGFAGFGFVADAAAVGVQSPQNENEILSGGANVRRSSDGNDLLNDNQSMMVSSSVSAAEDQPALADNGVGNAADGASRSSNLPDIVASTLNEAVVYFRDLERRESVASDRNGIQLQSNAESVAAAANSYPDDAAGHVETSPHQRVGRRLSAGSRRAGPRVRGGKFGKRKKESPPDVFADESRSAVLLQAIRYGWLDNCPSEPPQPLICCPCLYHCNLLLHRQCLQRRPLISSSSSSSSSSSGNSGDKSTTTTDASRPPPVNRSSGCSEQMTEQSNQQTCHCFPACPYGGDDALLTPQNLFKNATTNATQSSLPSWLQVGEDLRKIAESFRSSRQKDANGEAGAKIDVNDSILTVLLPSPLSRTMLATVLIYIGWRLLKQ